MLHVRKLATGEGTVLDYKCDGPGEKRLYSLFPLFLATWLELSQTTVLISETRFNPLSAKSHDVFHCQLQKFLLYLYIRV